MRPRAAGIEPRGGGSSTAVDWRLRRAAARALLKMLATSFSNARPNFVAAESAGRRDPRCGLWHGPRAATSNHSKAASPSPWPQRRPPISHLVDRLAGDTPAALSCTAAAIPFIRSVPSPAASTSRTRGPVALVGHGAGRAAGRPVKYLRLPWPVRGMPREVEGFGGGRRRSRSGRGAGSGRTRGPRRGFVDRSWSRCHASSVVGVSAGRGPTSR